MPENFLEGYKRHQVCHLGIMSSVLRDALYPFDPGEVTLRIEDWSFARPNGRLLHVTFKNWPNLGTVVDISDFDFVAWPESSEYTVARIVADHIKTIPYLEPGENVELGEN